MHTGKLRDRVFLDAPIELPDGSGGVETGWAEQFSRAASIMYLRGGETVQAARLSGRQPAVITLRADRQTRLIAPQWRLRDTRKQILDTDGNPVGPAGLYNIKTVIETEDRAWIEITAESGVAI